MKLSKYFTLIATRVVVYFLGFASAKTRLKAKRILFLGGINNAMIQEGIMRDDSKKVVSKSLLSLNNDDALEVTTNVTSALWDTKEIQRIMSQHQRMASSQVIYLSFNQALEVTDHVISRTPAWLRYDTELMQKDVMGLLMTTPVHA